MPGARPEARLRLGGADGHNSLSADGTAEGEAPARSRRLAPGDEIRGRRSSVVVEWEFDVSDRSRRTTPTAERGPLFRFWLDVSGAGRRRAAEGARAISRGQLETRQAQTFSDGHHSNPALSV